MLHKSKLVAIHEKRILLVRNRRSKQYNLPGGRAYRNETPALTLRRELGQELPHVRLEAIRKWRTAPCFKRKKTTFYFAKARGSLKTGAEIDRAIWARRWWSLRLSHSTRQTLRLLAARGRL